jgi:T6SS immunity protein Tdi1, C-terminal
MDELLQAIRDQRNWAMPSPERIVALNKFGNVLVAVEDGSVWRICPEEVSCRCVSPDVAGVAALMADPAVRSDWEMARLVSQAEERYGIQAQGRCFCLKIPGVLGGKYSLDNVGTNSVVELVSFAGHLGSQIEDLPDGATSSSISAPNPCSRPPPKNGGAADA